ncbi:unnamed protein product, partial [Polarella glacialis]
DIESLSPGYQRAVTVGEEIGDQTLWPLDETSSFRRHSTQRVKKRNTLEVQNPGRSTTQPLAVLPSSQNSFRSGMKVQGRSATQPLTLRPSTSSVCHTARLLTRGHQHHNQDNEPLLPPAIKRLTDCSQQMSFKLDPHPPAREPVRYTVVTPYVQPERSPLPPLSARR